MKKLLINSTNIKKVFLLFLASLLLILQMLVLSSCSKSTSKDTASGLTYDIKNIVFDKIDSVSSFKLIQIGEITLFYGSAKSSLSGDNVIHAYYLNNKGEIDKQLGIDIRSAEMIDLTIDYDENIYLLVKDIVEEEYIDEENEDINDKSVEAATSEKTVYHKDDNFLHNNLGDSPVFELKNQKRADAIEKYKKEHGLVAEGDDESELEETFEENIDEVLEEDVEGDFNSNSEENSEELVDADFSQEYFSQDDFDSQLSSEIFTDSKDIEVVVNPQYNGSFEGRSYYYDYDEPDHEYFYRMIKINKDGDILSDCSIDDNEDVISFLSLLNDNKKPKYIAYDDNQVFVIFNEGILEYDLDFNLISTKAGKEIDEVYSNLQNVFRDRNNKLYGLYFDTSNNYQVMLAALDLKNAKILAKHEIPGTQYLCYIFSGISSDFTICVGSLLYGYNFAGETKEKEIDFLASDISTDNVYSIASFENGNFYALYHSFDDGNNYLGYLTKSTKKAEEKKDITLAITYDNSMIKRMVSLFNKQNKECRIRIIDYNALYGSEDSYYMASDAVIDKLNTDIIAGNVPDILVLDSRMSIQTYINKGLLEDLYPYIENDEDFSLSDFNENIFEVFSNKGKLYRLIPSYGIHTTYTKKSNLEGKDSWTLEEAEELFEESDALIFYEYTTKDEALEIALGTLSDDFVNMEKGECCFNSDEFISLLKFINNHFDKTIDYMGPIYSKLNSNSDTKFKQGLVFAKSTGYLRFISSYLYSREADFGDDFIAVGFPNSKGNGSAFEPVLSLGMSAISDNKQYAWEFLRSFLMDDFQETVNSQDYGFPIKNSAMDKLIEKAKEEPLCSEYLLDDGSVYKLEETYFLNGEEYPVKSLNDETEAEFRSFIDSISRSTEVNAKIKDIVKEEADLYFNGTNTAEQAANNIQSRAQIYIYESQ